MPVQTELFQREITLLKRAVIAEEIDLGVLRGARVRKQITIPELARRTQRSVSTIKQTLSGMKKGAITIWLMAGELDVPVRKLVKKNGNGNGRKA